MNHPRAYRHVGEVEVEEAGFLRGLQLFLEVFQEFGLVKAALLGHTVVDDGLDRRRAAKVLQALLHT